MFNQPELSYPITNGSCGRYNCTPGLPERLMSDLQQVSGGHDVGCRRVFPVLQTCSVNALHCPAPLQRLSNGEDSETGIRLANLFIIGCLVVADRNLINREKPNLRTRSERTWIHVYFFPGQGISVASVLLSFIHSRKISCE